MTSYLVLSYDTLDELVGEVNRKGLEGWKPQGGLSILPGTNSFIFLQAIVREDDGVTIVLDHDQNSLVGKQDKELSDSRIEIGGCAKA